MIPTTSVTLRPGKKIRQTVARTGVPSIAAPKRQFSVLVWFSYFWIALIVALAITAPLLPIPNYDEVAGPGRLAPSFSGPIELWLGTDAVGRSLMSRLIYGAQISLVVGTCAAGIGVVVGIMLGLIAGYFRGAADWIITLLADVVLSFPVLVLLLAITAIFSPSIWVLLIGLAVSSVPTFIRLTRANTMAWASRDFVRAARNMGASNTRILLREILPNVVPSIAAYLPLVIAALIVAEGSLSFLGLGVPPPTPSWGGMINAGAAVLRAQPYMVFVPAAVLFLTVFALNQAGEHLRQRFDRAA
ncbi:ABC transporter permease [Leucobacter luti]|uniref:Peptide/nickel transport system permease protein n=1 Tax=Leucobacter luti TaxID=340320 RepID=A0A4Q7U1C6_9MICO|nr:ABC transporter permease [Leucobacter luti]MBL3699541.1 ABC transporter permease [Leucobacter luti]RZT67053.1 peptide/nickel transport system permease protein [Leucobacter luti]